MKRETIIKRVVEVMNSLPTEKLAQIADFAEFIRYRHDECQFTRGTQRLIADDSTFHFLSQDDDLYSLADIKH